jgi:hypothetical protein
VNIDDDEEDFTYMEGIAPAVPCIFPCLGVPTQPTFCLIESAGARARFDS